MRSLFRPSGSFFVLHSSINRLELAHEQEPVSFSPGPMPCTVPGPGWALGASSLSEAAWGAEGAREASMRQGGLRKLLEESPLGNAGGQ